MRALLSTYDKAGLVDFASALRELGWELISSGGTSKELAAAGIEHLEVSDITNAPEMLGGRVKTLHPIVHGGILADRSKADHMEDLKRQQIEPIDLVVCNLYPFQSAPSIEMIDVGGPTMVRAAAKNSAHVGIVVDPAEYSEVLDELRANGFIAQATRQRLARKAFAHTAEYDAAIVAWFDSREDSGAASTALPQSIDIRLEKAEDLRYGENPHQLGARYRTTGSSGWWDSVKQHSGMSLSYLNLFDGDAAWRLVHQLGDQQAAVIVKHANPCGVATAETIADAYTVAFDCDPTSAFGGIVALNGAVDDQLASRIVTNPKADVLIAKSYTDGAKQLFAEKRKNMRVLEASAPGVSSLDLRRIDGGFLVQNPDQIVNGRNDWRVATKVAPTDQQWRDLELAWTVCAAVGSNAIVIASNGRAAGIGAGQQNRLDSAAIAARKAGESAKGGACASDAFFPFRDGLDAVVAAGVTAVIQPGGSMRDEEVIAAADEHEIAMVLTGERHFRH